MIVWDDIELHVKLKINPTTLKNDKINLFAFETKGTHEERQKELIKLNAKYKKANFQSIII